eukprot:scaffold8023_cov54-Attheya_sp.AAC.5
MEWSQMLAKDTVDDVAVGIQYFYVAVNSFVVRGYCSKVISPLKESLRAAYIQSNVLQELHIRRLPTKHGSTCRLHDCLIKPFWECWIKRASCFGDEYQGLRSYIMAPSASRSDRVVVTNGNSCKG